ncbi:MAG: type III-A CRISPR-associated RAMP protein Csm4 [Lachnospirales bacterium]
MNYNIFKLRFKSPVHFGQGRLSSSSNTIYADTLFSALCIEAVKLYGDKGVDILLSLVKENGLRISDTFPYYKDVLLIPKPIISLNSSKIQQGNSKLKKKFKKLNYIPVDDIKSFIKSDYNPEYATNILSDMTVENVVSKVAIKNDDDNLPYSVGTVSFKEDYGLYFIISYEDEKVLDMIDEIINSLSYTGIGGKISSGYGSFDYDILDIPNELKLGLESKSNLYMSLSISMASDDEIEFIVNSGSFELIKRSGFVASEKYNDTPVRKKDFYCFKAGSCFKSPFNGNIFNVSSVLGGKHNVYRYALPMLYNIGGELVE